MVDLYRSVLVKLQADPSTAGAADHLEARLRPAIDDLQLALDRRKLSSEVHMLLEKRGPGVPAGR